MNIYVIRYIFYHHSEKYLSVLRSHDVCMHAAPTNPLKCPYFTSNNTHRLDTTFLQCTSKFFNTFIIYTGIMHQLTILSHHELPAVPFTAPLNAAAGYCRFFFPPFLVLELLLELAALPDPVALGGRRLAERLRAEGSSVWGLLVLSLGPVRMSSGRSFHSWPGPVVW